MWDNGKNIVSMDIIQRNSVVIKHITHQCGIDYFWNWYPNTFKPMRNIKRSVTTCERIMLSLHQQALAYPTFTLLYQCYACTLDARYYTHASLHKYLMKRIPSVMFCPTLTTSHDNNIQCFDYCVHHLPFSITLDSCALKKSATA